MNAEKEMQLAKVAHLKFALKASLQLVDHVHVVCQNDKVVYIYDHNHNAVKNLQNVQRVIHTALRKFFVHKEYMKAFIRCSSKLLQSV